MNFHVITCFFFCAKECPRCSTKWWATTKRRTQCSVFYPLDPTHYPWRDFKYVVSFRVAAMVSRHSFAAWASYRSISFTNSIFLSKLGSVKSIWSLTQRMKSSFVRLYDIPNEYHSCAWFTQLYYCKLMSLNLKDYVIRDMQSGLYARGTDNKGNVVWGKRPRRYKRLSDLSTSISYVKEPILSTWEIIEHQMVESARFSVATIINRNKQSVR